VYGTSKTVLDTATGVPADLTTSTRGGVIGGGMVQLARSVSVSVVVATAVSSSVDRFTRYTVDGVWTSVMYIRLSASNAMPVTLPVVDRGGNGRPPRRSWPTTVAVSVPTSSA
jgi:hypothetical protein